MSIAHSQSRTFLRLYRGLEPHLRRDPALPARIDAALRRERGIGSRDRRLYRELLYTAVRHLPWIEGSDDVTLVGIVAQLAAEAPATTSFRSTFARPDLTASLDRGLLLPAWFREECPGAFEEPLARVLQTRTPLWLRVRPGAMQRVRDEFRGLGWASTAAASLEGALRVEGGADVTKSPAYEAGLFEVQDLGSQMILAAVAPAPGGRWLDACAGAGGKTLQLADLLGADGAVDATDVRREALEELERRAVRAGFCVATPEGRSAGREPGARISLGSIGAGYDGVLVDAPCSGSGTWRRAPHLKWTSNPNWIRRCAERQRSLLAEIAPRVRPGGTLVYATCSLCCSENEAVAETFLTEHPEFRAAPLAQTFGNPAAAGWMTVDPARHDCDGFFVARFERLA